MLLDRASYDAKAYMSSPEIFAEALSELNTSESELFKNYDVVFHLITAADGAIESYTHANKARTETAEEAILVDRLLIEVWKKHHRFFIIDNSTGFEEKVRRIIDEILNFLKIN